MFVVRITTSLVYSLFQAALGLLMHPYQTMQHLIEEKIFIWLTLLPAAIGALGILSWWASLKFFFFHFPYPGAWAFLLLWFCFFCFFWQILLLYLLVRFLLALAKARR